MQRGRAGQRAVPASWWSGERHRRLPGRPGASAGRSWRRPISPNKTWSGRGRRAGRGHGGRACWRAYAMEPAPVPLLRVRAGRRHPRRAGAGRGSAGKLDQAALPGEGQLLPHPRAWRPAGPAGRRAGGRPRGGAAWRWHRATGKRCGDEADAAYDPPSPCSAAPARSGSSTWRCWRPRRPGRFAVEALVAGRDVARLAAQARRFGARLAVVADPAGACRPCGEALAGTGIETAAGPEAVIEAAARPVDWTMAAIVGAAGLRSPPWPRSAAAARWRWPTRRAWSAPARSCWPPRRKSGATLLPVDSEHNAIFQALDARDPAAIEKIVLTASGGPFRNADLADDAGGDAGAWRCATRSGRWAPRSASTAPP